MLIQFILTLPNSTTTIKHDFSIMKTVKRRLCNWMKDNFLAII